VYTVTNMCSPFQSELNSAPQSVPHFGTDILLAPIFMMIMCARGFILWIINVGLVIYLGVATSKLHKKVRWNNYTIFKWESYHNTFMRHKTTKVIIHVRLTTQFNTFLPSFGTLVNPVLNLISYFLSYMLIFTSHECLGLLSSLSTKYDRDAFQEV